MKAFGYLFILAVLLGIPFACDTADVMDKTVYVPDEADRNLPAYTEWGYNSFGAKYERKYFLASDNQVPCKVTRQDGILYFSLSGYVTGRSYSSYYAADRMILTFSFSAPPMTDYPDLVQLHGMEIDLTQGTVTRENADGNITGINPLNGSLVFRRAQLLSIDGRADRVILSGVFELRYLVNNRLETFTDGRFDFGINDKDFFSHPEGSQPQ